MTEACITLGVIIEKRKAQSPWIEHIWGVHAVLTGLPDAVPLTLIAREEGVERFYLGATDLVLSHVETANYRDNLMSGAPKLWVVLRFDASETPSLLTVTADPAEGEAHTETEANHVETVTMASDIAGFIAAFVDAHHVERAFIKRNRDKPEDARRMREGKP